MVGDANICLTEPEMQKQPAIKHGSEEQQVGKSGVFGPQGTKKTVNKAENHAGNAGVQKPLGGKLRGSHRIRRLNQPPVGRGSS